MRAVVLERFGPPEVLRWTEVPDPAPGPGEVLVEVAAAGVTFVETQIRAGRPPNPQMLPELPAVLGNGVAGRVVAVGDGVARSSIGATVVTSTGGRGGDAELAVAPSSALVDVPDGVDPLDALAVLADGRTALAVLAAGAVPAGATVLVAPAAGGVGTLLVQLLVAEGADVVAVVGSAAKAGVPAELGARTVVVAAPGWAGRVRVQVGPIDVAFDGVGGEVGAAALDLVRPGGVFVPFGMASGSATPTGAAPAVEVRRLGPPDPAALVARSAEAVAAVADRRLRPVVGSRVPMADAAQAHRAMEARLVVGKTLLTREA
ncbi:zinc-binding dehydrogenase [Dermatobacter hominis]|uniref:zinc-binding dehydrogenase n=1 Tax=Dermatobacter hominis TaxID=2884263 RepID=UPI001D110D93|nr:zinc-binding dehydrogenase [Dermatobacter hominis]UDY36614.1 zinc-binding dehydrogenase [Dermatobacter hominis]